MKLIEACCQELVKDAESTFLSSMRLPPLLCKVKDKRQEHYAQDWLQVDGDKVKNR